MAQRQRIIELSNKDIISGIQSGDRVMLGRAITLVESKNQHHQDKAEELLSALLKIPNKAFRIAISGAPGVGKSTFIETLGMTLVEKGNRVAVLSIDPSSDINKGSILGDKTRMDRLSIHPNAFIRPSPAGDYLGGIAWRTREAITLCEAAGYNIIIIETVGVGQSEFKVREMVDCFFLLLAPGGGDELQGMKKGIVEIADIISINKSDGDLEEAAKRTRKEYSHALHLFPSKPNGWNPKVLSISSITGDGIDTAWNTIESFRKHIEDNGTLSLNRRNQDIIWFKARVAIAVQQKIEELAVTGNIEYTQAIVEGKIDPIQAARDLVQKLF